MAENLMFFRTTFEPRDASAQAAIRLPGVVMRESRGSEIVEKQNI